MPRTIVPAEGGALPAGRLFIEVTPAMRRALELLADATILVLEEIDGDVDVEDLNEDGGDVVDEPHDERDQGDDEASLGWTIAQAGKGGGLGDHDGEQFLATTPTEDKHNSAAPHIWDDHEPNVAAGWGEFQRGIYPVRQAVDETEVETDTCVTDRPHDGEEGR